MSKKNDFLKLALVSLLIVAIALAFSGCQPGPNANEEAEVPEDAEDQMNNEEEANTPSENEEENEEEEADTEEEEEEEVVPEEPEPTTIIYTYMVPFVSERSDLIEAELNEMIHEQYPWLSVKLDPISQGDYAERMSLMFSSGSECDVVFTPKWLAGIYNTRVANGDLMPLNSLLETTPTLLETIPELAWTGAMVGDTIYAVPGNQINVAVSGINIMEPMLEKYPLDWDSIEKVEDIEPWLAEVFAAEEELLGFSFVDNWYRPDIAGYDSIDTGLGGAIFSTPGILGVQYMDESRQVVNLLAIPEFAEYLDRARRWVELGYLPSEVDPEIFVHLIEMKYIAQMNYAQPHDWWVSNYGIPALYGKALAPPFYANFRVGQNSTGICATSEKGEASILFLELLNTDVDIFNTLLYGIEGEDWVWVEPESNLIARPEGYDDYTGYVGIDWALGNQFLAYYRTPTWAEKDVWALEAELNESATPSVMLGFSFDRSPVEAEIAQVTAVLDEYAPPLVYGWTEDWETGLADLLEMLDAAGLGVIQAEMQSQVDAWAAGK
jgi:putative aldouronate transport system substrate-binding protein